MRFLDVSTFFTFLTFLYSCDETEPIQPHLLSEFWDNLLVADLDSSAIANNLIGTWRLTHRYCCPESTTGGLVVNVENEAFEPIITPEKICVLNDGMIAQESSWSLQNQNTTYFSMESNPYISNTFGQTLFAENRVLFYSSPSDDPDNYFQRVAQD